MGGVVWIVLIGVFLAGIVAVNVVVLQLLSLIHISEPTRPY